MYFVRGIKIKKNMLLIITAVMIAALFISFRFPAVKGFLNFGPTDSTGMNIIISMANPEIRLLSADASNKLYLRIIVKDKNGHPVSRARINLDASGNTGGFSAVDLRTGNDGEALAEYIPYPADFNLLKEEDINVTLTAHLSNSDKSASIAIKLAPVPVIFIHGYKSDSMIFDSMRQFFNNSNFRSEAFSYTSEEGVIEGAKQLAGFLQQQKSNYLSQGFQVERFDIITHSMGGLVARYYTCSDDYMKYGNVRKLVFMSVPHRGSLFASFGAALFDDTGIRDMIPGNRLFTEEFPSMLNNGLNDTIETVNILGQYDEVVSPESASLEEWDIKTEMFNVGDNNFTMDSLLDGTIMEAANHKLIINNNKVFEKVEELLITKMPYPSAKR